MSYRCSVCGREYQSRSGLRRHVKSKHRVAVPVQEALEAPAGSEAGEGPAAERSEVRAPAPEDFGLVEVSAEVIADLAARGSQADLEGLLVACKELEVEPKDVMAYKVYHEPFKVVIIEGPVGYKRVWCGG